MELPRGRVGGATAVRKCPSVEKGFAVDVEAISEGSKAGLWSEPGWRVHGIKADSAVRADEVGSTAVRTQVPVHVRVGVAVWKTFFRT